jgi:hypothetical protein
MPLLFGIGFPFSVVTKALAAHAVVALPYFAIAQASFNLHILALGTPDHFCSIHSGSGFNAVNNFVDASHFGAFCISCAYDYGIFGVSQQRRAAYQVICHMYPPCFFLASMLLNTSRKSKAPIAQCQFSAPYSRKMQF